MTDQNDNPGTALVQAVPIQTAVACAANINVDANDLTAVQTMIMEVELERQIKELLAELNITEQTAVNAKGILKAALDELPKRFTEQADELAGKLTGFEAKVEVRVETTVDHETLEGDASFTVSVKGTYGSLNLSKVFKLTESDPIGAVVIEQNKVIKAMEEKSVQLRRDIAQRRKTLGNFSRIERMARGAVSLGILKSTDQGRQLLTQLGVDPDKFAADNRDIIKGVIG